MPDEQPLSIPPEVWYLLTMRRFLALQISVTIVQPPSAAAESDMERQKVAQIVTTVERLCLKPASSATETKLVRDADIEASVSGLFKKLVLIGGKGSVTASETTFMNLSRAELQKDRANYRDCARDLFIVMYNQAPKYSHPPVTLTYRKPVRSACNLKSINISARRTLNPKSAAWVISVRLTPITIDQQAIVDQINAASDYTTKWPTYIDRVVTDNSELSEQSLYSLSIGDRFSSRDKAQITAEALSNCGLIGYYQITHALASPR